MGVKNFITERAIMKIAQITLEQVLQKGKSQGKTSIETEPIKYHVDKAIRHIKLYKEHDTSEPHLQHALTRLAIAISKHVKKEAENGQTAD